MMSSVILLTTKWSGVTSPETTDSPKPKFESITITERSPLPGCSVNITPAVNELAIFCTPTLIASCASPKPRLARYAMARPVYRLEMQRRMWQSTSSTPRIQRKVSCWPAKLAPGRSSVVALDLTATGNAGMQQRTPSFR